MRLIDADKLPTFNQVERITDTEIEYTSWIPRGIIEHAPTVEAIPIEWIKGWANNHCIQCYDYDYPTEKDDSWYAIDDMLKYWEKKEK